MGYAAYADDRDRLDHVVDEVIEAAGGDMRTGLLDLVRRQHRSEEEQLCLLAGYAGRAPRRSRARKAF